MLAKHNGNRTDRNTHATGEPPKRYFKRYKVTAQTAYHITEIALREGITEGRVIDKLMRTYLATQRTN